ncbi:futalosine hydrolase [Micromonospora olivasterospora]|uniref:Futalosine hydrolase n=1 Tax=Micromonospora olivasterospora TaxID=1880 RepID=A0A562IB36_MICOL|nr:futalosine hydrolase [Micromonospora olivasterospora]TWH68008.1 futalosine hydrolase [Micromonospora olivasterospora]
MTGLLVVTAVPAEADAVRAGLANSALPSREVTVAPVGVGPAVAAAATARLLTLAEAAGRPYGAVVSAGIAGGFAGRVAVGGTVLATRSVAADLGAESPDGFIPVDELGMPPELLGGGTAVPADPQLLAALRAALPAATVGAVLTVSTVTGTAASTQALADRYPDAVAEGMEGYGVAVAAAQAGLPFAELRTVSNPIGPRDRGAWRMREAFAALAAAAAALA